jgi:hypothetical protein
MLSILRDGKIWASSVYHLNDSFEYRYGLKQIENTLRNRLKYEHGPLNQKYGKLLEELDSLPRHMQVYVASFSKEGDLLSQWLSYPRSPNGYALGFSEAHFLAARRMGFTLMPCVYTAEEQTELVEAVVSVMLNAIGDNDMVRDGSEAAFSKALTAVAAIKHEGFSKEAEWRLIKTLDIGLGESKNVQFRHGRNGIVPYLEAPLETVNGQFVPTAIHIGPNEDMPAAKLAVETLLDAKVLHYSLGEQRTVVDSSKTPYRP